MHSKVALASPATVEVTVQITATTEEWQRALKEFPADGGYDINQLRYVILEAISWANGHFNVTIDHAKEKR